MIRLLILVFLIFSTNQSGRARNNADLSGIGIPNDQTESTSEFISDNDLIFFDCILENGSSKVNLISPVQNDLFPTHPVNIEKKKLIVKFNDINLLSTIRKDNIFLSTLRL